MRKVVAFAFVSLDGVAESPDGFVTGWDDVLDASGAAPIATQDAVVLGRRSYDEWVEFWPTSEIEPFATFINGVAKYVATFQHGLAVQLAGGTPREDLRAAVEIALTAWPA